MVIKHFNISDIVIYNELQYRIIFCFVDGLWYDLELISDTSKTELSIHYTELCTKSK